MEELYYKSLQVFLKVRPIALLIVAACMLAIYFLFNSLPSELAPLEDRSNFRMSVTTPEGTSFDYTADYVDRFAAFVRDSIPEAKGIFSSTAATFIGGAPNTAFTRAILVEPKERRRSQQELVDYVNK